MGTEECDYCKYLSEVRANIAVVYLLYYDYYNQLNTRQGLLNRLYNIWEHFDSAIVSHQVAHPGRKES